MGSAIVFVLVTRAATAQAPASDNAEAYLSQAKVLMRAFEYTRCLERLEQANALAPTAAQLVDIEVHRGLCLFLSGKKDAAEEHFWLALRLDPDVKLSELTSPKIIELFEELRAKQKATAPPPRTTPPDAPVAPPVASAATPPPAQSTQTAPATGRRWLWPSVSVAVGAVALGAGVWLGVNARAEAERANGAFFASDAARYAQSARLQAVLANVGYGVAAVAVVTAVVVWWLQGT